MEFYETYTTVYVSKKFGNTYTLWGTGNYYLWLLLCTIRHLYRLGWASLSQQMGLTYIRTNRNGSIHLYKSEHNRTHFHRECCRQGTQSSYQGDCPAPCLAGYITREERFETLIRANSFSQTDSAGSVEFLKSALTGYKPPVKKIQFNNNFRKTHNRENPAGLKDRITYKIDKIKRRLVANYFLMNNEYDKMLSCLERSHFE